MTLQDHVAAARSRLVRAGLADEEAAFDAELLARHLLAWDRATYFSRRAEVPPLQFGLRFKALVRRRERREPISHIVGVREFWGLEFEVSRDVLTPRPETELVVEEAIAWCEHHDPRTIVDVGTGSGCLAISFVHAVTSTSCRRVVAVDLSPSALHVARRNAIRHGVASRIDFVRASLLSALAANLDLILANPPYIPERDRDSLPPEVRDHEPALALFGGADGLDPFRALVDQAAERLRPRGALVAEFGIGQEPAVRQMIANTARLTVRHVRNDLQGIARVAVIERRETD